MRKHLAVGTIFAFLISALAIIEIAIELVFGVLAIAQGANRGFGDLVTLVAEVVSAAIGFALCMLTLNIYRRKTWALAVAVVVMPLAWLITIASAGNTLTGSQDFGEHASLPIAWIGWGSAFGLAAVYLWELVARVRSR